MRRRDQWIRWMKAVEREAEVVAVALDVLHERLQAEIVWKTPIGCDNIATR